MRMPSSRCGILTVLLCSVVPAAGQWGGRFIVSPVQVGFERDRSLYADQVPGIQAFLGLGLDHRMSERTTLGFEVVFDVGATGNHRNVNASLSSAYGGQNSIGGSVRTVQFVLRSLYEEGDNVYNSLAFGPVIGVRTYSYDVNTYVYLPNSGSVERQLVGRKTVVPVGVRFGYQFDRGFFVNVFGTLAYQLGSGESLFDMDEFKDVRVVSPILFEIGVGIGYRGNKYRHLR